MNYSSVSEWRGGGTWWATPDQEALDEVNDEKILRAVQESMADYYQKQKLKNHRYGPIEDLRSGTSRLKKAWTSFRLT